MEGHLGEDSRAEKQASQGKEIFGLQGRHGWDRGRNRGGRGKRSRRGERQCGPPSPPTHLPPGWGRPGRGVKGEVQGRGPEYHFRVAPTYCAASRVSMVVLGWARCRLQTPPLFIPWPSPLGGAGVPAAVSSARLKNPLREGVRGGGWIAQPLGHVAGRVGPGSVWIWGSPGLGWGD